ncbi:hypothetical protein K458DRAFT_439723 [Lentithecium fluviatile CBS 122367]|uniref:Uncharacterized protein n=1 Tax=Lentithecium fluviatile CBS 122367 TaxID=1168545 RepID=A0A6G1JGW3_9PLEO|nr:hypothetical protein K458DRAFT_439723 [Lentithecium fluviatile CBS 122367]
MSDADYEAFLNKANQDTSGGEATTQSKSYSTKSVNTAVPEALESVEEYYTSDADEPFEPVALEFDGESIDAKQLKNLLGHGDVVEEISVKDWDPKGQYKKVLDAVKKATDGEVKVFRVELEGTRMEYYVVGVSEKKVVGLKALSVES